MALRRRRAYGFPSTSAGGDRSSGSDDTWSAIRLAEVRQHESRPRL